MGIEGYEGFVEEVGCEDCKSGVEKGDCVEMVIWQVSSHGSCKEVEMYVGHMYWWY